MSIIEKKVKTNILPNKNQLAIKVTSVLFKSGGSCVIACPTQSLEAQAIPAPEESTTATRNLFMKQFSNPRTKPIFQRKPGVFEK